MTFCALKPTGIFNILFQSCFFFLEKKCVWTLFDSDRGVFYSSQMCTRVFFFSPFLWTHSSLSKEGMQKSFQLFHLTESLVYDTKPGTALENKGCYWTLSCHDNRKRRVAVFNHTKSVNITLNKRRVTSNKTMPCDISERLKLSQLWMNFWGV